MVYVWYDEAKNITPEMMEAIKRSPSSREFRQEYMNKISDMDLPKPPPRKLSVDPNNEDFHPCYLRVGVRIDGEERNDILFYDLDMLAYMTTDHTSHLATEIDPYWRWEPNRQQRRAEERWEAKHG